MRLAWALLILGAGCFEPDLVPCGDISCPAGDVCVSGACVLPSDVRACDGLADGASCHVTSGGAGTCVNGSCQSGLCGNGAIDPGELCDGTTGVNVAAGQTCSADCQRVEVCGNGVVDPGEQCDDGNANPADGCDACTLTVWNASALIGGNLAPTSVGLGQPGGVAVDRLGNVYIADSENQRIRKIDPNGVMTTVAGTGATGTPVNGGLATSYGFNYITGVAVDGLGTLFISDLGNSSIYRVDIDGVITQIAGNLAWGYSGDGGPASSATLNLPNGVAVDGLGDVYIADTSNYRIRRVDTDGVITTIAGDGTVGYSGDGGPAIAAELNQPVAVAVDDARNVYIADEDNHVIRKVDATGMISTVAGTGTPGFGGDGAAAIAAELNYPTGVMVDGLGNIYVSDRFNCAIRRIDVNGVITTVAGTPPLPGYAGDGGAATSALLAYPQGAAIDAAGNLYVADHDNNRIRKVDTDGAISTLAGNGARGATGEGGAATAARLQGARAVAADAHGNFYIADGTASAVRRVDAMGVITTIAGNGAFRWGGDGVVAAGSSLDGSNAVLLDAAGNVFIGEAGRVRKIDTAGIITTVAGSMAYGNTGDGGPATSATMMTPVGLTFDATGNLFIVDSNSQVVRRVDTAGMITTVAGTGTAGYSGDGGLAVNAQLDFPQSVAFDPAGNMYIADALNNVVRRVSTGGIITAYAGTGNAAYSGDGGPAAAAELTGPDGLAFDTAGNLYLSDTGNHRVRRITPGGVISTFAGNGQPFLDGDGSAALTANVYEPAGLAFNTAGDLYIVDGGDQHVRRVDHGTGTIWTVAGAVDPEGTGPIAQAHLANPRAFVVAPAFSFFAGGSAGVLEDVPSNRAWLEVTAGRYPTFPLNDAPANAIARLRTGTFGTVSGIAYDEANGHVFIAESNHGRLHVITIGDPNDVDTWTIAPLAGDFTQPDYYPPGYTNGTALNARFRDPTALYFDATARQLYIADTGNHVIRAIDLTGGVASATVRTVAGTGETLGFFGDGGPATAALLFAPQAITKCANGDMFIADTGNNRVRRIAAGTGVISTVLGDGVAASSGEGTPASSFPVDAPLGLACDALGNLFVTSTTTIRLVPANAAGIVDGTGAVHTIYGAAPRTFPASATACLTGIAFVDDVTMQVTDSCTGLLVSLHREPAM